MTTKKSYGWLLVLLIAVSVSAVASDTVVVSINGDAQYTAVREISIELVYSGTETPTEMRVYATGADWSEWFNYTDSLDWVLSSDDGLNTINVETRYWVESKTDTTVYGAWRVVAGKSDIFLDMTPPVLTASLTPDATEYGWYNGPVSVVFQANDAGSGLAASPGNVRFNQEGAGQSITRKAVDNAGNETEITVSGINIDMTAPVLTVSLTPDATEYGWYNVPVSVVFQANDAGSGLAASPANVTFDQEGAGQSIVREAVDKAGNKTEVTVSGINIDMTAPVLTVSISPGPNKNGWHNEPVTVAYTLIDSLSGNASVPANRIFSTTSDVTLAPKATDKAGNMVRLPNVLIHIDVDDPLIVIDGVDPGASPDVWVAGPVTITSSISDAFSGVASIEYVAGAAVMVSDGGAQLSTVQVTDLAGNTSTASVSNINIDSTLPTTTVLLADSEGASGANVRDPVLPIDLKAKLDAFGTYDLDNVALGYSFADANLTIYATIIEVGETGVSNNIQSYQSCEFAPTGGFYYFVLPADLVSGQLYEIWFEEIAGSHIYRAQVVAP